MAIHKVDDRFVISSHGCWLPGTYESERAARYAFRFCEDHLCALRDEANELHDGIVTFDAMERLKQAKGFLCGQGAHRPGWKEGDPIVFDNGS